MPSNLEQALQSIKRIGAFSEAEKNAMQKAFRKAMFPGNWSSDEPNDNDLLVYDAALDEWVPEASASSTFLSLSDTPANYSGSATALVRVNAAKDGLEFTSFFTYDLWDVGTDVPNSGDVLTWDPSGPGQYQPVAPTASAVTSVNTYTGVVVLDMEDVKPTTTKGDIIVDDGANAERLAVGTDGHVLIADSATTPGVKWAASPSGFADPMTTRGDVIVRNAANTTARLAIGANTFVLTSDGTDINWAASISGVSDFLGLSDTPANYTGSANKFVVVNGAANALEFTSVSPVTQVTGTSPIASSGGTTPAISIQEATAAQDGYMTSVYATKLDGIENGADVTDAINVAAAGAYMGTVTVSTSAPSGGSDGDIWFEV